MNNFALSLHAATTIFNAANVALVLGTVLVLAGTIAVVWTGGIKERYADERTSKNESDIADANQRAAEANERSVNATLDLTKANERIAELNKIAEDERLARVKIEQRLAPRTLTGENLVELSNALRSFAPEKIVVACSPDTEPEMLARLLVNALVAAGWIVSLQIGHDAARIVVGVLVEAKTEAGKSHTNAATALCNAIKASDVAVTGPIAWQANAMTGAFVGYGDSLPDAAIRLTVGTK
jgi:hypothetical protein